MKQKSVKEILDDFHEQEYLRKEAEQNEHAENLRKRSLLEAGNIINSWKRQYFRKNAKHEATISILNGTIFLKTGNIDFHRIQLFIEGNFKEEYNIMPEAFDVLVRDLEKIELPGLDRYTYKHHEKKNRN